jgi:hypothetical protein
MHPIAVALIVKEPSEIYLDFLLTFAQGSLRDSFAQGSLRDSFAQGSAETAFAQGSTSYDIYIIIDSDKDQTSITELKKYKKLNFVQFDEKHCLNKGYKNVNYIGVKKLISGWDKALLFFSVIIPKKYKQVWFIEDDVFFFKEQILTDLDARYPSTDLIANCDFKSQTTNNIKEFPWLWSQIDIKIPKPHYSGMMCITRMSNKLLQCIRWYATQYKTLFFLEALFPTLISHFKLSWVQPIELTTVTYRDVFFEDLDNIKEEDQKRIETHIFHPIKDINKQMQLRSKV